MTKKSSKLVTDASADVNDQIFWWLVKNMDYKSSHQYLELGPNMNNLTNQHQYGWGAVSNAILAAR